MSAQRRLRALDAFISMSRFSSSSVSPAASLHPSPASAGVLEPVLSADYCAGQWVAAHKDITYTGNPGGYGASRPHPRHKLDVYHPWHVPWLASADGRAADPRVPTLLKTSLRHRPA